jgi:hypothetical protein
MAHFEDRGYRNADPDPDPIRYGSKTRAGSRTPAYHYLDGGDEPIGSAGALSGHAA